jgi:hypothetical protein
MAGVSRYLEHSKTPGAMTMRRLAALLIGPSSVLITYSDAWARSVRASDRPEGSAEASRCLEAGFYMCEGGGGEEDREGGAGGGVREEKGGRGQRSWSTRTP